MKNLEEILRLNPNAASGLEGAREALADIKKIREAGMAPGPLLLNLGRQRVTLDQLKASRGRRSLALTSPVGIAY